MSNVIDKETNKPLAEGNLWHIAEHEGRKIGLVRLYTLASIRIAGKMP